MCPPNGQGKMNVAAGRRHPNDDNLLDKGHRKLK